MAEATSIGLDGSLVEGLFKEKAALPALLKALCQAAMAAEVAGHVGAGSHERSESRRGHRNGKRGVGVPPGSWRRGPARE